MKDKIEITGIEYISMNTDAEVLALQDQGISSVQLGPETCKGMGAGMKPEVAAEAVSESIEEIKEKLEGADLIFLATGLGGGTGSGAIAPIAQICQEIGAMTVAVVTTPFSFEAKKRTKIAKESLENLKKSVNSLIIIDNNKIEETAPEDIGMRDAFNMADNVLANAINGILNIVLRSGIDSINIDFADLRTALNNSGQALISTGYSKSDNAAEEAVCDALNNPLLETTDIFGCKGIIINWTIHPKYSFKKINKATDIIYEQSGEDTDLEIIYGINYDESLELDEVNVTILATGFVDKKEIKEEKEKEVTDSLINDTSSQNHSTHINAEILNVPSKHNKEPLKIRIDETTIKKDHNKQEFDLFASFKKRK
jgi:cell division protein FtsZ